MAGGQQNDATTNQPKTENIILGSCCYDLRHISSGFIWGTAMNAVIEIKETMTRVAFALSGREKNCPESVAHAASQIPTKDKGKSARLSKAQMRRNSTLRILKACESLRGALDRSLIVVDVDADDDEIDSTLHALGDLHAAVIERFER